MRFEHKIGLSVAVVAFVGGVSFAYEEANPVEQESPGNQLLMQDWVREVQFPPTLVTATPRAIPTLVPQSPRPNPIATRVSVPTNVPSPEKVALPTPTFIPDFEYPKYVPEPLGSKLNEPGGLPIDPLAVGVSISSVVFLSGIGFCVTVRGVCRGIKMVARRK